MEKSLAKRAVPQEWYTPKHAAATCEYYRAVQDDVIAWWREHQRTDLPWRPPPPPPTAATAAALPTPLANPYEVWVSEVMSQQTRMETVISYFKKWMEKFPSIEALAASSEEEVKAVWAGMGYYRRALYLHKGAQYLLEWQRGQVGGVPSSPSLTRAGMPSTQQELLKVPGIGPYTSAAVAAVCFGQPVCSVDGNVIRVLSRLRGERAFDPKVPANVKMANVWGQVLMGNTPQTAGVVCCDPSALNQGLMEIGAAVCRPGGAPLCTSCPLQPHCCAYSMLKSGEIDAIEGVIPMRAVVAAKRSAKEICVVHQVEGEAGGGAAADAMRYVVVRRPSTGLLAGMLEFPTVSAAVATEEDGDAEAEAVVLLEEHPLCTLPALLSGSGRPLQVRTCGTVRHIFSHIVMDVEVLMVRWPAQLEAKALCRAVTSVIDECAGSEKEGASSAAARVSVMTEAELRHGAPSRLMLKVLQQTAPSAPPPPKRTRSASTVKKGRAAAAAAVTLPVAKCAREKT